MAPRNNIAEACHVGTPGVCDDTTTARVAKASILLAVEYIVAVDDAVVQDVAGALVGAVYPFAVGTKSKGDYGLARYAAQSVLNSC